MKVLITGAGGMLARALGPELARQGMTVEARPRSALDVTRHGEVERAVREVRPDVVVQCAAYTAVDAAEDEPAEAFAVNAEATESVADACQRYGALLVYPSTDYVFSGEANRPYRPDDPVAPLGVYGASKVAGEAAARRCERHLIIRTSWLYGEGGRNFVDRILEIGGRDGRLQVVDDQVGKPTWTGSLSYVFGRLLKAGAVGTFHAADGGEPLCWYDFAKQILHLRGVDAAIVPISSGAYGARAPRPRFSILDCTRTEQMLGEPMPAREASLVEYLSSAYANKAFDRN